MPAPVRERAERRGFFKRFGKRLQAGGVHSETEFPIADREWIVHVELVKRDFVPRHQRVPVHRRGVESKGPQQAGDGWTMLDQDSCWHR